jgi:PII-like signaling protein
MSIQGEQVLLRIYLESADRTPHTPTYQRIVRAARHENLAGATTLRGILGFGAHGLIKRTTWSIVEHVPVIIEIVDRPEKITAFVSGPLAQLVPRALATLERASVMMYRHRGDDPSGRLNLGSLLKPLSTVPPIPASEHMQVNENGVLLRVFVGESDQFEGRPLYEAIVRKAQDLHLAGATVLRGSEGFGAHSVVHESKLLELSRDLPVVIELVDTAEKIQLLLPSLEAMVAEGMITMEYVMMLLYRQGQPGQPTAAG